MIREHMATMSYFFASMAAKWVLNSVLNGLKKVLKSLKFNLEQPAGTLYDAIRVIFQVQLIF